MSNRAFHERAREGFVPDVLPRPFDGYSVLQSADADSFRSAVSQFLTPHRLSPLGKNVEKMRCDVAAVPLGPIVLVYARHVGGELKVDMTEHVDYYDVNISHGGRNRIDVGGEVVFVEPQLAGVISPNTFAQMHVSEEYRQLHVRIERIALTNCLEELLGGPVIVPIRFDAAMDLRSSPAASWARAVQLLLTELEHRPGLAGISGVPTTWAPFLMTGLLFAQHHNYSERLAKPDRGPHRPAPVKRAIDLIESDPTADLRIEVLAREVGASPRSLYRHFREHVGVSPREFVEQIRMARAHDELVAAQVADGRTVADIALDTGFTHVSRFAGAYKARYGRTPSQTLRS